MTDSKSPRGGCADRWRGQRQGSAFWVVLLFAGTLPGCGALPPLPGETSGDGGAVDASGDNPSVSLDVISADLDVVDVSKLPVDVAGPVDSPGKQFLDAAVVDGSRADALIDAPLVPVCPAGFADCNGDTGDGCETSITTAQHCGGCKSTCGSVANGSAACVNGKCAVKCTAPYQDCDGKYDNGCEIPVGQANACDRSGLAAFSGSKPPCGTPYCGSAAASDAVTSFGSWHCSFCDHCYVFGNGGSYCLYSSGTGNFSGERCATCCAAGGSQVCPR